MPITEGDRVTFEYVGRLADGTVFDTSRASVAEEAGLTEQHPDREYGPLTVEVGAGRIVEGLESELLGLEAGDTAAITVAPEDGYGRRQDKRLVTFDREEFGEILRGADPEPGVHVQDQQGTLGEVVAVEDTEVRVDFNHELAGKIIEFEVEIVEIG